MILKVYAIKKKGGLVFVDSTYCDHKRDAIELTSLGLKSRGISWGSTYW